MNTRRKTQPKRARLIALMLLLWALWIPLVSASDPYLGPVLDVHLHAFRVNNQGPPPVGVCTGEASDIGFDPSRPWGEALLERVKSPPCKEPIWSPTTNDALRNESLRMMAELNVVGIVSGPDSLLKQWHAQSPKRIMQALEFNFARDNYTEKDLDHLLATGQYIALGEVSYQYEGIAPDDARFDEVWAVAAKHDVAVGIHIGVGPPGAAYVSEGYRARLHNPLALEEMLTRHPTLRVWVMHAAWPMREALKAMLYAHPQLYVDTGTLQMALPRAEYYHFLENLVRSGFIDRIMYGTDQMVWPGLIKAGISAINDAPFLTTVQKKRILYDNAHRSFRLNHSTHAAN